MNRTLKAGLAVVFILIITFCVISVCQNVGKSWKADVTEQKIYTLSKGTKAIISKIDQPLTLKLYYARTAALKGPDQIRFFNNYYQFVKALLDEYVSAGKDMIKLEVIDPRPYSNDEEQAIRLGLKRFPITQEENFFFGLVVQTQFGVEKTIPFFSPERQNFVEYDISYLIDTAITRQKHRIGILSSLPVMGNNLSPYMLQMMQMQGKQPKQPWSFVEQLKQQYEVKSIPVETNSIDNVDILMVIHPKKLKPRTLFAIDQFVMHGGRTIIMTDPYCVVEQPDRSQMRYGVMPSQASQLNILLNAWGLNMPADTFAGDRSLAIRASLIRNQRPQKIIGFLDLRPPDCFNKNQAATAQLNSVRMLFAGVLKKTADANTSPDTVYTPLLMTTNRGNSWSIDNPYELMMPNPSALMAKFHNGSKPVDMAYMITGKLRSAFPDGIDIKKQVEDPNAVADANGNKPKITVTEKLKGITECNDCALVVFSDVDFISDILAYQKSFLGTMVVGDNAAVVMNVLDSLAGSPELVSIRSRGNYKRPFTVVDQIEARADAASAEDTEKIKAEISGFENELRGIVNSANKEGKGLIGSSILQKKKDLELKILQGKRHLKNIQRRRVVQIEKLGNNLRDINMFAAPLIILLIAVLLAIFRATRKRSYIVKTGSK